MIPLLKKYIKGVFGIKENPYYTKIRPLIERNEILNSFKHVLYLGGCLYNEENHLFIKNAISEAKLGSALNSIDFNIHLENIEVYYFVDDEQKKYMLMLVLDPYELNYREEVLDVIEVDKIDYELYDYEVILPPLVLV